MKYQLIAENEAEEKMLKSEFAAFKPAIDVVLPLIQTRSIMAAHRLGIFKAIGTRNCTANQLASELSLDAKGAELMLRVLISAGYVNWDGKQYYSLTELTRNTLLPDSPASLTGQMDYAYIRWSLLDSLEDAIKTGKGTELHRKHLGTPEKWAIYQQAMLDIARSVAPKMAPSVPVRPNARLMLDIGGGHGLYGAMICRLHPPMRSVVLDLPGAVEQSRKLAIQCGIDDVVSFRAGDALKDDLGTGYDLVYIGGVIHHFSEEQNQELFRRSRHALAANGILAVLDTSPSEISESPDLFKDSISLLFHINTGTQSYTPSDCIRWMKAAGFAHVTEIELESKSAPGDFMVTGENGNLEVRI